MREKGLQSIKKVIAEDYDKQLAQENKNLHLVQKSVDDLVKKQNKDNNRVQVADRQSQTSLYEQMIKEKKRRSARTEANFGLDVRRIGKEQRICT
uniref:Uncharacterized protein n=1 Tax=Magallana gigas TaxID=29159 RepID=K1QSW6_MAGGI